ncbi:MAG: hypothetical protein JNN16_10000 [Nitrospira sp.]|nr:hypothetical protein [Nitrospira sp.]
MRATGARANGGAFPSDMYESGKRETDPIAFQIHFATGAWGEIMGAGGANLVDRYRREVLRLCGSVGIARVSRFRGGRSGIRTVTRRCGVRMLGVFSSLASQRVTHRTAGPPRSLGRD